MHIFIRAVMVALALNLVQDLQASQAYKGFQHYQIEGEDIIKPFPVMSFIARQGAEMGDPTDAELDEEVRRYYSGDRDQLFFLRNFNAIDESSRIDNEAQAEANFRIALKQQIANVRPRLVQLCDKLRLGAPGTAKDSFAMDYAEDELKKLRDKLISLYSPSSQLPELNDDYLKQLLRQGMYIYDHQAVDVPV